MTILNTNLNLPEGKIDLLSIGETLIDLISKEEDVPLSESVNFNRHFGGSAANLVINMQRLGNSTALVSRIGDDAFGKYILQKLDQEKVNIEGLQVDKQKRTPVIFVNKSHETPAWLAYRGADMYIKENNTMYELIDRSKILYLTTFILTRLPSRETVLKALEYARKQKKIIAFDPCFRESLWPAEDNGEKLVKEIIGRADFVKPSLDDAYNLFGKDTPENYCQKYLDLGVKLVMLTMGKKGVLVSDGEVYKKIPVFSSKVVDVTGAGDSFWSGFLTGILDGFTLLRSIKLGNGVAAFKIRGVGALSHVPPKKRIIKNFDI